MGEHVTVRIPDLPDIAADLSLSDRFPVWQEATNTTRNATLAELRSLVLTGGSSGSYAPVTLGSTIIVSIPAELIGETEYSMADIAGKDFILRRRGTGIMVPGTDYEILDAGGFKLLREGDQFFEGDVFEIELFGLQAGESPTPGSTAASFVIGAVQVSSSLTMNATHKNKLMQIRAGRDSVVLTLPKIEDYPENIIIPIEASINNVNQARVTTQDGQNIYMLNSSYTSIYMGKGNVLWLFRGVDGWYVINEFANVYADLGGPYSKYKAGLNELVCDGSLLNRADYPRLWEWVQTLGSSLVTEAQWQTASVELAGMTIDRPFRGCFSAGNGSTTFRIPDLRNLGVRGLKGSADTQRHHNYSGGYQNHQVVAHDHKPANDANGTDYGLLGKYISGTGNKTVGDTDGSGPTEPNVVDSPKAMVQFGGTETRMENFGAIWVLKY